MVAYLGDRRAFLIQDKHASVGWHEAVQWYSSRKANVQKCDANDGRLQFCAMSMAARNAFTCRYLLAVCVSSIAVSGSESTM